jgi:hypothetical protein
MLRAGGSAHNAIGIAESRFDILDQLIETLITQLPHDSVVSQIQMQVG